MVLALGLSVHREDVWEEQCARLETARRRLDSIAWLLQKEREQCPMPIVCVQRAGSGRHAERSVRSELRTSSHQVFGPDYCDSCGNQTSTRPMTMEVTFMLPPPPE